MTSYYVRGRLTNGEMITVAKGCSRQAAIDYAAIIANGSFTDVEYCGDGVCTSVSRDPTVDIQLEKMRKAVEDAAQSVRGSYVGYGAYRFSDYDMSKAMIKLCDASHALWDYRFRHGLLGK